MTVAATYYDGKSSMAHPVELERHGNRLRIVGGDLIRDYLLDLVKVSTPVANTHRFILLPDGSQCDVDDSEGLDALLDRRGRRTTLEGWVDWVERRATYTFVALALLVLVVVGLITRGVPLVAKFAAFRISASMEAQLGSQSLAALDKVALRPTQLEPARQSSLANRFDALVRLTGQEPPLRLQFRSSENIGPNAFALPGGNIILLDKLVTLARDDDAIAGVLAHEIGHERERHMTRTLLQGSLSALLLATIFGDALSGTSYVAALPTLALDAAYSRDFEREADDYAVTLMGRAGIDRKHYVNLLQRLEERDHETGEQYLDFLQSHPNTIERIERVRAR